MLSPLGGQTWTSSAWTDAAGAATAFGAASAFGTAAHAGATASAFFFDRRGFFRRFFDFFFRRHFFDFSFDPARAFFAAGFSTRGTRHRRRRCFSAVFEAKRASRRLERGER